MAKKFSWSYSRLKNFTVCPHRSNEVDNLKNFQDGGDALIWGNQVHDAMAKACRDGAPLPSSMAEYQRWVDSVRAGPGQLLVEQKYAITKMFGATPWMAPTAWYRGIADVVRIHENVALALDWKGLPLATPLPTLDGWTTMGAVRVGDLVYGADGRFYPVTGKSAVKNVACVRIETTSGFGITCDIEHRWQLVDGRVVAASGLRAGDRLPLPEPVVRGKKPLPVDPYVLGVWLADGKHTSGEITKPDGAIWEQIQARGYTLGVRQTTKVRTQTVLGLYTNLQGLGVAGNKHVPEMYLLGSVGQRRDLLAGFVDGDGTVNRTRRQVVVDLCDPNLLTQIVELARSLGERVLTTTFHKSGFGKTVQVWRAAWRPRYNPFLLPRKRDAISPFIGGGQRYIKIRSVQPCETTPTQCIEVASPDHLYLCGREYLVTHNTGQVKEDSVQLALMAQCIFAHYPAVEAVRTEFVWLQEDCTTPETFIRADMAALWKGLLPRVEALNRAFDTKDYPKKPSGLCMKWCPVKSCEFHGKGSR